MSEGMAKIEQAAHELRLRFQIQTEAKLQLLYAEQSVAVAKQGLQSLYDEYTELSKQAESRREDLQARLEETTE